MSPGRNGLTVVKTGELVNYKEAYISKEKFKHMSMIYTYFANAFEKDPLGLIGSVIPRQW